jgi:hypothetical protein
MRLRGDMMRREHPAQDALLQAAGGVGSAVLLPGGELAKGASLAEKAMQGAKVGAIFGGANGVGSGEDTESRLINGGAGLATGALLGEAVPHVMATRAGQAVSRVAGSAASNTLGRILPTRAAAAAAPAFEMLPNNSPVTEVTSRLEQVSAGIDKAIHEMGGYGAARKANAQLAAAGRGDQAVFADLGKPLTAEAKFAANNSSAAHNAISDVIDERTAGSTQRVIDDFKGAVGDVHAPTRIRDLADETKAWADGPDGYGTRANGLGLRAQYPEVPLGDAAPLVSQPRIRNQWAAAKATSQIGPDATTWASSLADARAANPQLDQFLASNPKLDVKKLLSDPDAIAQLHTLGKGHLVEALQQAGGNTFDNVQDLLQSLQDAASSAFASGKNNLGQRMKESASLVQKTLEDHIPGYADITDRYAQRKALERAVQDGVDMFHSNDITALNQKVASMTPAELEQFRHGMASEQLVQLQGQSGANQATKTMIAKNAPARTAKLKVVFGDEKTYDAFMERAKAERQLGMLSQATGGSSTHFNEANAASHDNLAQQVMGHGGVHMSVSHRIQNAAIKAVLGPMRERQADAMTPALLTKGTDAIDALINFYEAHAASQHVGRGATTAAPASIGSLFGSQVHPE